MRRCQWGLPVFAQRYRGRFGDRKRRPKAEEISASEFLPELVTNFFWGGDEDAFERVVDFHALRYTFITNLARSGVHPKMAQSLARHSDINLTMNRYTHTALESQQEALAGLPDLSIESCQENRATGTDNTTASQNSVGRYAAHAHHSSKGTVPFGPWGLAVN